MVQQVIDVGSSASDGTGDPLRDAFTKINDNFTELYTTVDNEGLTYGNVASNVAGITFNVTRYTESYAAAPVLRGTGQVVGNVYVIRGNVLGGSTPLNDVLLTVTTLANVTVGNIATVSATGVPIAPVLRVNGLTGNVTLTVNNITGAASKAYVNAAIAANVANVTGSVTDSLRANITAANAVISNHSSRITTLESNSAAQATQINSLVAVKANVTYVDTSISNALSSNAILANVAAVNANVAAANAAILLRANLTGATFSGNIRANSIQANNTIRATTYFIGGTEANQGLGQTWANPAALFFGNSAQTPGNNKYYQINLQNLDPQGSGDIIVTADDGNDLSNYIALGIGGSQYNDPMYPYGKPHDGYVAVFGGNLQFQSNIGNVELMSGNLTTAQIILTTGNVLHLNSNLVIRFPDGTLQSTAFGGNANISIINANITAANAAITSLQANAVAQALELDNLTNNAAVQGASIITLTANAGNQAASINAINANLGSYQSFANSNAAVQSVTISAINANLTASNLNITRLQNASTLANANIAALQSNTGTLASSINSLTANATTQGTQINIINANLTAANASISLLSSNAATQATQINLLNANLTAANVNITTLQSNATSQALAIDNLYSNINFYLSNVASSNANIAAANARIITIDANLGGVSSNIATLQSNAAAQSIQLNVLNGNIGNVYLDVLERASLYGAIFYGNVRAQYLYSNANVKVTNVLEVGQNYANNLPGLGGIFVGNITPDYQVIIQNLSTDSNATTALKILPDDGGHEDNFIKIGINSSQFSGNVIVPEGNTNLVASPRDGYVVTYGGNTSIRSDRNVFFAANTVVAGLIKDTGNFALVSCNLQFQDGTIQTSAITDVPALYANIGTAYVTLQNINASIVSTQANLGAYQTYSNANATSQATAITSIIANVANLSYTPGNAANYNGTITNIQQALDQLAARIKALGG